VQAVAAAIAWLPGVPFVAVVLFCVLYCLLSKLFAWGCLAQSADRIGTGSRRLHWLDGWLASKQQAGMQETLAGMGSRHRRRKCMAVQAASLNILASIGLTQHALAQLGLLFGVTVGLGMGVVYRAWVWASPMWVLPVMVSGGLVCVVTACYGASGMACQLLGLINTWCVLRGQHMCLMSMHFSNCGDSCRRHARGTVARKRVQNAGKVSQHHQPIAMGQVLVMLLQDVVMHLMFSFCCSFCIGLCVTVVPQCGAALFDALVGQVGRVVGAFMLSIVPYMLACIALLSVVARAMGSVCTWHSRHISWHRSVRLITVLMFTCLLPQAVSAGHGSNSTTVVAPGSVAMAIATVATATRLAIGALPVTDELIDELTCNTPLSVGRVCKLIRIGLLHVLRCMHTLWRRSSWLTLVVIFICFLPKVDAGHGRNSTTAMAPGTVAKAVAIGATITGLALGPLLVSSDSNTDMQHPRQPRIADGMGCSVQGRDAAKHQKPWQMAPPGAHGQAPPPAWYSSGSWWGDAAADAAKRHAADDCTAAGCCGGTGTGRGPTTDGSSHGGSGCPRHGCAAGCCAAAASTS